MDQCLNKLVIELLLDGKIFDYDYLSRQMDSIYECQSCAGYDLKCDRYVEPTDAEKFKMYFEGIINE